MKAILFSLHRRRPTVSSIPEPQRPRSSGSTRRRRFDVRFRQEIVVARPLLDARLWTKPTPSNNRQVFTLGVEADGSRALLGINLRAVAKEAMTINKISHARIHTTLPLRLFAAWMREP